MSDKLKAIADNLRRAVWGYDYHTNKELLVDAINLAIDAIEDCIEPCGGADHAND